MLNLAEVFHLDPGLEYSRCCIPRNRDGYAASTSIGSRHHRQRSDSKLYDVLFHLSRHLYRFTASPREVQARLPKSS